MITLQRNKQEMKYALFGREIPLYQYKTEDGVTIPIETGETRTVYFEPIKFSASINNKLDEVLIKGFGIDETTNYAQIVVSKGYLPLKAGSLIWKKSEVRYEDAEETIPDKTSCDYIVKGVADEGLSVDLFLLQKNV